MAHGTGNADRHRFLAKRGGIGPKPTCALQCNSLQIEGAHQHHGAIKRDKQAGIGGEGRGWPVYRAIGREVVAVAITGRVSSGRQLLVMPRTPTSEHPGFEDILGDALGKAGHKTSDEQGYR